MWGFEETSQYIKKKKKKTWLTARLHVGIAALNRVQKELDNLSRKKMNFFCNQQVDRPRLFPDFYFVTLRCLDFFYAQKCSKKHKY